MVLVMAVVEIFTWRPAMKALKSRSLCFNHSVALHLPLGAAPSRRAFAPSSATKKYTWN